MLNLANLKSRGVPEGTKPLPTLEGNQRDIYERLKNDPLGLFTSASVAHDGPFKISFLPKLAEMQGVIHDKVGIDLAALNLVLLPKPRHLRHVLIENHRNYVKGTKGYRVLGEFLGKGLVTSEGDLWKRQRRIINPAFHRKRVKSFADTMTNAAVDMVEGWRGQERLDLTSEMMTVTLRVICETMFGADIQGEASKVEEALSVVLGHVAYKTRRMFTLPQSIPTAHNRELIRATAYLDELIGSIIASRRKEGNADHNDLLSMLMEARDEETGAAMDDVQLRDEVVTIFAAGHETTAMWLTWTMVLLSQHPTIRKRLQREILDTLGPDRPPTLDDLESMPLLDRVLNESLRHHPPVPALARSVLEDDVIDGYHIPAGHYVILMPWVTHRDPDVWPNPEGFDPDRFLPEVAATRPKMSFFPFSAGQRKCIGDVFAKIEAKLIAATILQRTSLDLVPGQSWGYVVSVTLRPGGTIAVKPVFSRE